jgi:hypothetical protein
LSCHDTGERCWRGARANRETCRWTEQRYHEMEFVVAKHRSPLQASQSKSPGSFRYRSKGCSLLNLENTWPNRQHRGPHFGDIRTSHNVVLLFFTRHCPKSVIRDSLKADDVFVGRSQGHDRVARPSHFQADHLRHSGQGVSFQASPNFLLCVTYVGSRGRDRPPCRLRNDGSRRRRRRCSWWRR